MSAHSIWESQQHLQDLWPKFQPSAVSRTVSTSLGLEKEDVWLWQQLVWQQPWPCTTPKGCYTDTSWWDVRRLRSSKKDSRQNKTQKARCAERKEGRLEADRERGERESRRKGPRCWVSVLGDDPALSIAGCSPPAQGGRLRLISFCQSQFSYLFPGNAETWAGRCHHFY